MNDAPFRKDVLIHIGPHKTGSSAMQKSLSELRETLEEYDVCYLYSEQTRQASLNLANEQFTSAEAVLKSLSKTVSSLPQKTIVISHEDFCGSLPGKSPRSVVYPKLTKNLRILTRCLRPHSVRFVFFLRDEADWLRSCYHQHLKYRFRFHSLKDFEHHFGEGFSWTQKLQKPKDAFGDNLLVVDYDRKPKAGIMQLLEFLPLDPTARTEVPFFHDENASPSVEQIAQLERINRMTEFGPSSWFSKLFVLKTIKPMSEPSPNDSKPKWPPKISEPSVCALPSLLKRSRDRVQTQKVEDILPSVDVDLEKLASEMLPSDVQEPKLQRADIKNQATILSYHLRGKSRLSYLNGLCISYLRRDTPHTGKARMLFHRIWREQGHVLVNELSTRWLISTLQTFLDHGENEHQRLIGSTGYFYGNMLKIYEGERAIEGLQQDGTYTNTTPQTKNRFRGLDRYSVGGTDLMLNTNALALEIALKDEVAGLVLQEFLLRVKTSENVFSRHDRTRQKNRISIAGFSNVWAFFEPWR